MQRHEAEFIIDAAPPAVWRLLFWTPPAGPDGARVIESGCLRIEILHPGDDAGQGLVRTCRFPVPRWLLSGGVGRSWECITEARINELSRYVAISKPLWSRAEGWHRLEPLDGGRTRLTFGETYHAFNPLSRFALAQPVHRFISRNNDRLIADALAQITRVSSADR